MKQGYLTVYMALSLTIILSLALALIEGSRSGAIRMEAEIIAEACIENILAEYHREALKQYNILALDTSYGEKMPAVAITGARLQAYLDRNCAVDRVLLGEFLYKDFLALDMKTAPVRGVRYLTDGGGEAFRRRAVEAFLEKSGISYPKQIWEWVREVEEHSMAEGTWEQEREAGYRQLDAFVEKESLSMENEGGHVGKDMGTSLIRDSLAALRALEGDGVLKYVVKEQGNISNARIDCDPLVSMRRMREEINTGNLPASVKDKEESAGIQRLLFQEYMLCYGSYYGNELEKSRMKYQLEYVIGGRESDRENLKTVVERILIIREAANMIYLMGDETKREGVKAVSEALSAALLVPEAAPLLEAVILMGWAYLESLVDVRGLLAGNRVPLMKSGKEWKTDIDIVFSGAEEEQENHEQGLSYGDYLRILLLQGELEEETFRFLDMLETDIRETEGNEFFRIDACVDQIEVEIDVRSRYGYEYKISRCRGY